MKKTIGTDDSPRTGDEQMKELELDEYLRNIEEISKSVNRHRGATRRPFFDFLTQDEQDQLIQQYCGCDANEVSTEVLVAAKQLFGFQETNS
jgi:hypothetical protein